MHRRGEPLRSIARILCRITVGMLCFCLLAPGCSDGSSGGRPTEGAGTEAEVTGTVSGPAPLGAATVAFIEASAATGLGSLQPLEDLAATAEVVATTEDDGRFLAVVPPGSYFVHVTPSAGDSGHLPGGDLSRSSMEVPAGASLDIDIRLSERPSEDALYVGSSRCLECHPERTPIRQTLHFVGLRRLEATGPGTSSLQDLSRFPEADRGLSTYEDGNPQDNTGSVTDGYGYRLVAGGGTSILLGRDEVGFFQALEGPDQVVSERLYVEFTYGGEGLHAQLYLTRLGPDGSYSADPALGSYQVLPARYQETKGDPARGGEVTVAVWTLYEPGRWGPSPLEGGPPGAVPAVEDSFDNQCAGCHFNGMSLRRDETGLFQADAVADPAGVFDYDGDGQLEEIHIGCERCHGPGSEHSSAEGLGPIVHPGRLAPGRAAVICGQCHARGAGNGTIGGAGRGGVPSRNDPETGEVEFVTAGISAAAFFGQPDGTGILPRFGTEGGYLDPVDLATEDGSWMDRSGGYGARYDHAQSRMQHYLDHTRSLHFQNLQDMLVCHDCHDPHSRKLDAQLNAQAGNNTLCLDCHRGSGDFEDVTEAMVEMLRKGEQQDPAVSAALDSHIKYTTFDLVGVSMNLGPDAYRDPARRDGMGRCVICHMPKTARSGGWITDEEGFTIEGDIPAHTWDVISPDVSRLMARSIVDPVPNSCVPCHRGFTLAAWPDYRYRK